MVRHDRQRGDRELSGYESGSILCHSKANLFCRALSVDRGVIFCLVAERQVAELVALVEDVVPDRHVDEC